MKKIYSLLVLSIITIFNISAYSANIGGRTIYFDPGEWDLEAEEERYAAFLYGGTMPDKWYDLSDDDADGIYSFVIEEGADQTNVIFCKMHTEKLENNWGNRLLQSYGLSFADSDLCKIVYVTGTNCYANWSFEDTSDVFVIIRSDTPFYYGDNVVLEVIEDNGPYTWYYSSDKNNWIEMSGVDKSYTYNVVEDRYFKVVDASGKVDVLKITASVKADNLETIYLQDFDDFDDEDQRKSLYEVEHIGAMMYSNYNPQTESCSAIRSSWNYALLANPRNAGCNDNEDGAVDCNCYKEGENRWYRDKKDNTENDTYGGMLLFNCGVGSGYNVDELFYVDIEDVYPETEIEFSFYMAAANVGNEYNMPVNLDVALYDITDDEYNTNELHRVSLNHILLSDGWKKITTVFKANKERKLRIKVFNTSNSEEKNDILIDDLELKTLKPKLRIKSENGYEFLCGESVKLSAILDGYDSDKNYYLWQSSTDNVNWVSLNDNLFEDKDFETIVRQEGSVFYRVLVSKTEYPLSCLRWEENKANCKGYEISNVIEVSIHLLDMSYEFPDPDPCLYGKPIELILSLRNPMSRDLENVRVGITKEGWDSYKLFPQDDSESFDESEMEWNIGDLMSSETKTISLIASANENILDFGVYLKSAENLIWTNYNNANTKIWINKELNVNYEAWNLPDIEYCGTQESNLVEFASCHGVDSNRIKYYEDKEKQNEVVGFDTSIPTSDDGKMYYAVFVNDEGCESEVIDVKLRVKELPKLVNVYAEESILCNDNGQKKVQTTINYKIEGGEPPYTISYETINKDGYNSYWTTTPTTEGSFEVYPEGSLSYNFNSVTTKDGCSVEQNISPIKIEAPTNRIYTLGTSFTRETVGVDYTLSFDDIEVEFDTYQWQASFNSGETYVDLVDTTSPVDGEVDIVEGAQTTELKIKNPGNKYETIWYRIKLSNSETPCIVYYSTIWVVRMDNNDILSLNISTDGMDSEAVCEGGYVEVRCNVLNSGEDKENIKIKLDVPTLQDDLNIVPSVGVYDETTQIWSIDRIDMGDYEKISIYFKAKEDDAIRVSLESIDGVDYENIETNINFKVLKAPVIGELKTPENICQGSILSVELPTIESEAEIYYTNWLLDGEEGLNLDYPLSYEHNGSTLQYKVVNRCGESVSNEVVLIIKGYPEMEQLDQVEPICAGQPLNINPPYIEPNGNTITNARWLVNEKPYIEGEPISLYGEGSVELLYEIESECGGVQRSDWGPTLIINESFEITELKTPAPICDNGYLNIETPYWGYRGAEYIGERWVLDGEEFDVFTPVPYSMNGAKLRYELIGICDGVETITSSNEVEITVLPPVRISNIPDSYNVCDESVLDLEEPLVEYSIAPNDYIKYDSYWTILNGSDGVLMEKYQGQRMYSDGNVKKIQYRVTARIYNSPEDYTECETYSSNIADLVVNKKPYITWMFCEDRKPACEVTELPCKLYYEGEDEYGNYNRNYYINWNNAEDGLRNIKTYLGGEEVLEDYVVKYPDDDGKQYYYVVENECGTDMSEITSLSLIDSPEFHDYTFLPVCAGDPLEMPTTSELVTGDSEFAYSFMWYINDADFTKEEQEKYQYPVGERYMGEPIDESYDGKTIYYTTSSECGEMIYSTPTKISIKQKSPSPEVSQQMLCSISDNPETAEREDLFELSELVLSDKTELKFYDSEYAQEPMSDTRISLENTTDSPITYTYWVTNTETGICESLRTQMNIIVENNITTYAGDDQKQCDNSEFIMNATTIDESVEVGEWLVVSTFPEGANVVIETPQAYNSKIIVPTGTVATLRWTVQRRDCPPVYDEVILTNMSRPTISASFIDNTGVVLNKDELQFTCRTLQIFTKLFGAEKYIWENGQMSSQREFITQGEYSVIGIVDEIACESLPMQIEIGVDKTIPVITLSTDTTHITCKNIDVEITSELKNENPLHTYTYQWSNNKTSKNIVVKEGGVYKLKITDNITFCSAEKYIEVKENLQVPLLDIVELPSLCLPAMVNLFDAIGEKTITDEIRFFEDFELTQKLEATEFEASPKDTIYYAQGIEVDNNGCLGDPYLIVINMKSKTPKPEVIDYNECTREEPQSLISLVTSSYNKLNFYTQEDAEVPVSDIFDASVGNTSTSYWVSDTGLDACESERAEINVYVEGMIDFDVSTSESEVLAGTMVDINLTENSVSPIDSYVWYINDEKLMETTASENTYSDMVYVDKKYSIQALGRCNSKIKDAYVHAIWPTVITPHDKNGKNDIFAPGMHVMIFDRHSQQIFEGNDGWDGTMNMGWGHQNDIVVPDVYYYSVTLHSGEKKTGSIEIVRM